MGKQITYNEPYFDPRTHEYDRSKMTAHTIIANTQEEYDATMAAILDPERGITLIDPLELPETPDPAWFPPKVDRDEFWDGYIAGLMGN